MAQQQQQQQQQHYLPHPADNLSPYSSHSGSSGRPSLNSFGRSGGGGASADSYNRHIVTQEEGSGSYHTAPPLSHGVPPMAHNQAYPSRGVKLPPSMMNRPAPMEAGGIPQTTNGNVIVSVDQIISKLDTASEENLRLRNALLANNQLLDRKLQQFEPLIAENEQLKKERDVLRRERDELDQSRSEATNKFFEARVAVMGFKCRTMQLQGEMEEMKKTKSKVTPEQPDVGRLQQLVEQLRRDNQVLNERIRSSRPGGMDPSVVHLERQVAELNKNVYTLQNEKSSYEMIVFQLQQDLKSVQDKKQLEEEEKIRAVNEVGKMREQMERVQRDNQALVRQMDQLRNNISVPHNTDVMAQKAQFESESLHLQARVQELNEHISKMDSEMASERRMNEQLRGKIHELEEAKKDMRNKLQSYSGTQPREDQPPRPTPAPRTNIHSSTAALQADKERLEKEVRELHERLDVATKNRSTVEEQFQQSTRKCHSLAQEKFQLEKQLDDKDKVHQQEIERLRRESSLKMTSARGEEDRLRTRVSQLQKEKEELRDRVADMEKISAQKGDAASSQELTYQSRIARLEEQLRQLQLEPPATAPMESLKAKQPPIAKRLNDALGKIRELETMKKGLEQQYTKKQEEYKSLQEEHSSLKNKVEVEHETKRQVAENQCVQLQRNIEELQAEQSRLCEDKFKLQQELQHIRGDYENKVSQLSSYERQLVERNEALDQVQRSYDAVRAQFDSMQQDKEKKTGKLSQLQNRFTDVKKQLDQASIERDDLRTSVHQLQQDKGALEDLKKKIEGEKAHLDKTVKEYRAESESILNDYTQAMDDLRATKGDRDHLQQLYTKCSQDLNEQIERSRLLENQRREVQEKLGHMDEQLKLYHEDFERERHAREAAIKVKNLAEERMKKMERDMKELRDRLNVQAARRLREDQYDDQPPFGDHRKSGEHRFSDTQPSNLAEPNRFSGPHRLSGHQEPAPPRPSSGQQHSGPQYQMGNVLEPSASIQPSGAPPIPPKGMHGAPPTTAGGYGIGATGGIGGAVGGVMGGAMGRATSGPIGAGGGDHMPPHGTSWTHTQAPTHYSPSSRVPHHANTMMITGHSNQPMPLDSSASQPLRAILPAHSGFPGPNSNASHAAASMNRFDSPGQTSIAGPTGGGMGGQPRLPPLRAGGGGMVAVEPSAGGGNPPNQLNDLNQPQGDKYVAPGEVINEAPPSMACPLCGKSDFKTQTDLELHCAQCG